ncbi:hypothetical protein [Streptomyces nigrescens]|uniref:hypothetical protein n=1 Tax=Streptomyces nigrescens TaxID=1920 RepID=UPI00347AE9FC
MPCSDPSDGGSKDRIFIERAYRLKGVPGKDGAQLVRQADTAWREQGHIRTSQRDLQSNFPTVNLRTKDNNFHLYAIAGVLDKNKGESAVTIGVTSACIWPDGTSE